MNIASHRIEGLPQKSSRSRRGWLLIGAFTLLALVLNIAFKKSFPLTFLKHLSLGILINCACLAPFLTMAIWRSKPDERHTIGLALGIWFLFYSCLGLVQKLITFSDLELDWTGKVFIIAASFAFIGLWRGVDWREIGFTGLKKGAWLPSIVIALALGLLGSHAESGATTRELLVFQLAMPGISEEIIFRGIMLALFNKAFGKPWKVLGASVGWGWILSSVLFGLMHGIGFNSQFQPQFSIAPIIFTGMGALIMGWLRERTGSLYPPIVVHGLGDGAQYILDVLSNGFA